MTFSDRLKRQLDEIAERIPPSALIGRYMRLTKKGREYQGLCPFHNERTPSFTVNDQKGFYHCFGCGAHGDVFKFLQEYKKMPFMDAAKMLADELHIKLDLAQQGEEDAAEAGRRDRLYEIMAVTAGWFSGLLYAPTGQGALRYLQARGLTEATIKQFGLGFAPHAGLVEMLAAKGFTAPEMQAAGLMTATDPTRPLFRDRLIIPIHDGRGRVVAFGGRILDARNPSAPKYLNSAETEIYHKGKMLYGTHQVRNARTDADPIVVEGYMDVIALHQAGFTSAVAPLGTALTEDQLHLLWRQSASPILCFDGDAAGQRAAVRAVERSLPLVASGRTLRVCMLTDGKDPDDLVRNGPQPFSVALAKSMPLSDFLWQHLTQERNTSQPEERARLELDIKQTLAQVTDGALRYHIQDDFRARLRALTASKTKTQGNTLPLSKKDPFDLHHKILLLVLINHPILCIQLVEELSQIEFTDNDHKNIATRLLDFAAQHAEEIATLDTLRKFVGEEMWAMMHMTLDGYALQMMAPFTRASAAVEDARDGWHQTYAHVVQRLDDMYKKDRARTHFIEDFSEDAWQILKKTKNLKSQK